MAGCGCSWFCCGGSLVLGLLSGLVVSHPVRGSVGPWVRGSVGVVGVDEAIKGY